MSAFVTAGAGFLLAVLWFDLMFDVQRETGLDSTAAYYARVTTGARPMNFLVATVMVATLAAIIAQLVDDPGWAAWTSLGAAAAAVGIAGARTVPNARRLGARADPQDVQLRLAHAILRDHQVCFALIATVLVVQLAAA